ncbi:tagatose kinase [Falsirhodobacter xinxiangensis]|uniref:tagatose kinase n=1 Tax=Falsirhodobacter xinxiangensis TaxID=2530049 RepID=UPI001C702A26|nr:sugar kinase [Rhodobacter xinxiangensis]
MLAPDELGPTLCIGEILVEIVADTVGQGFTEAQALTGPFPSGAPAIFIDQCGRIGGSAAMIGTVGDDDFGRLNIERLHRDGIDVSAIAVDPELPTGSAFVRYRPDGSRDFVFNLAHSAAARIGWTDPVRRIIDRAAHLHVMGTALAMTPAWPLIDDALESVRARGGTVSFDPNLRKELITDPQIGPRIQRVMAMTNLLLPSEAELELVGTDPERLFAQGISEIVVKRGAAGAIAYRPGEDPVASPAFVVEERDPTGAGDCFGGAYVACRRLGLTVQRALDYASAAGARNVTFIGPMEGAGTRAELDAFIATTERRT